MTYRMAAGILLTLSDARAAPLDVSEPTSDDVMACGKRSPDPSLGSQDGDFSILYKFPTVSMSIFASRISWASHTFVSK